MAGIEARIRELAAAERRVANLEAILAEKVAAREAQGGDAGPAMARRIANIEIILAEKKAARDAIKAEVDAEVGRTEVRLSPLAIEGAHDGTLCVRCGRDLEGDTKARRVRTVVVDARIHAMAPEDVRRHEIGRLALPQSGEDAGWRLIGPECIRKLGAEWTTGTA